MTIKKTAQVIRTGGVMTTSVDNDLIILNMKTSNYIALNDIGRRIWELLETPILVNEICRQLSSEFSAPPSQIEMDVITFLNELQIEELLHVVDV